MKRSDLKIKVQPFLLKSKCIAYFVAVIFLILFDTGLSLK